MGIWKANVASEANAENLVTKVRGKTDTAELVQKIENRFGKKGELLFFLLYYPYLMVMRLVSARVYQANHCLYLDASIMSRHRKTKDGTTNNVSDEMAMDIDDPSAGGTSNVVSII